MPQHPIGNTIDLKQSAASRAPAQRWQPLTNLCAQRRPVHRAGGRLVLIQGVRVKRRVTTVGPRQVRDHHMRMQLWISRPRHPVPIRGRDEPIAPDALGASMTAAREARLPLQV